ncbi:MAG: WYL domain-containing protein [Lachnospiraceae bacterium]|nr:WYL domain-containing protein [Lachnospiraceae bacterium]
MSEFKELIKSFARSREYIHDFFVYGFKTRDDFTDKSRRTYDNERRRIESWLWKYIHTNYTQKGKNISLVMDSRLLDTNPLYRAWKTKSFTTNDIMLHFYLPGCLDGSIGKTAEEITDLMLDKYGFLSDVQLVRRKCNEYVKEGLLDRTKSKKQVIYKKNPSFNELFNGFKPAADALCFYKMVSPLGIIGDTILDTISARNTIFHVKHCFFVHTLEDEILLGLLSAMHGRQYVTIHLKSSRNSRQQVITILPMRIFTSTRTGRRYLCTYNTNSKRFFCLRMDYIKKIQPGGVSPVYDKARKQLSDNQDKAWGVSFQNKTNLHMHSLELVLYIDTEKEPFVLKRLYREGKGGNVSQTGPNTFTYTTQVFDANEMLPWIRTFTGRIIKLETTHPGLKNLFMYDMEEMYKMYGIK